MLTADMLLTFLTDDLGLEEAVDPTTKLFSTALVDSFQMMSLVEFVENRCGFRVPPDDVRLENLDTIDRILAYSARMAS